MSEGPVLENLRCIEESCGAKWNGFYPDGKNEMALTECPGCRQMTGIPNDLLSVIPILKAHIGRVADLEHEIEQAKDLAKIARADREGLAEQNKALRVKVEQLEKALVQSPHKEAL